MSTQTDRRAPGTTRIPFEVMVEVGGALGPSFEAQAVDVSEEGMHLRTAYVPEVGQPITCRFDAEHARVEVQAEVIWKNDMGRGGEFGLRFTNLEGEAAVALRRLFMPREGGGPGAKVRLHIDGLGSSMRARIRDEKGAQVVAYSDLGFLQTGKQLDLEDAVTGERRPAHIDRIDVELEDGDGAIPQLVISMRYDDIIEDYPDASEEPAASVEPAMPVEPAKPSAAGRPATPPSAPAAAAPSAPASKAHDAEDEEPRAFRGAIAEHAAKVAPALNAFAARTKAALALAWAKRQGGKVEDAPSPRRTTSPPPGGGLHASGRKVVRTEDVAEAKDLGSSLPTLVTKRRAAVAGAVVIAGALALVAMRKPAPRPAAPEIPAVATTTNIPPPEPVTPAILGAPNATMPAVSMPADTLASTSPVDKNKKIKVAPFSNGPVGHGNTIKIKMDGAIEKIQGASQPTGFTVVIPGRKSVEPTSPLASKDGRIGAIRVSNDPNGAELTVNFKDGVPNYRVGAKGDTLEIAIASQKAEPKEGAKASAKKHGKHH